MQPHVSNWLEEVVVDNDLYRGRFVVHDEQKVHFSAATFAEADAWIKASGDRFDTATLLCFYVGKNFLRRYFPSIRIKSHL